MKKKKKSVKKSVNTNANINTNVNVEKPKTSKGKIATKIMAAFLAGLMVLSVCGTLIYYLCYVLFSK